MCVAIDIDERLYTAATVGDLRAAVAERAERGVPRRMYLAGTGRLLEDDSLSLAAAGVPLRASLDVEFGNAEGGGHAGERRHVSQPAPPPPSPPQREEAQHKMPRPQPQPFTAPMELSGVAKAVGEGEA